MCRLLRIHFLLTGIGIFASKGSGGSGSVVGNSNTKWGPEFAITPNSIFSDVRAKSACVASTAPIPGPPLTCNETVKAKRRSESQKYLDDHGKDIKAKTIWRVAGLVNSGTNFV